ncbi:MAG: hypothetical protein A2252_08745 [Elusimicrobia bacterium RIFOXYA2_FULL_39_19]|nr:MAG: hypothetical protein A2252_08745 [Elusimicrobia bacterium RIFOXYA2_FULL_39_19]
MSYLVYLDESGDHSLELVDKDFPLFALAMFICEKEEYTSRIVPSIYNFKIDFFGQENVVLHSRDIRKAQKEFGILTDSSKRKLFIERLNGLMSALNYELIVSVIKKQQHKDTYGINANNPYDLAIVFCLERLLPFLEDKKQTSVQIIAESRGKKEDEELYLSFIRTVTEGTVFNSKERFKQIEFSLKFFPKAMNIIGTQLADLSAYPVARYVHNPYKENKAYEIVKDKIYKGRVSGLKIFP